LQQYFLSKSNIDHNLRKYDEENNQTPGGLNLIFLPYADDLRKMDASRFTPPTLKTTPQREHILCSKRLINALSFDFDSCAFENPALQSFYSSLQGLALGDKSPSLHEDYLLPDSSSLALYAPLVLAFRELVFEGDYRDPDEKVKVVEGLGKRKTANTALLDSEGFTKNVKLE